MSPVAANMEALQFSLANKSLKYTKIPVPRIRDPKNVLVRVSYAGICGTDLHIIQGHFPCNPDQPLILGHEFSGTITEVGAEVTDFEIGDKVSVDPNIGCKKCTFCHEGNPHFCKNKGTNTTIGIFRDGGWAEYVTCPETQVHKLPESITLEQAALCEPLSCLAHGWDLAGPIKVGKNILITGAGIIGIFWACALHLHGHRRVTVSEPKQSRLNSLKKLDLGFDLITPDELKERQERDPEYLFDFVIECSGFPPAIEHGISLLNQGGKLVIFGVAPPHANISISPFDIYAKELKIIGVNINPYTYPNSIGMVEAMGDRYLNYDNLGIRVYSLREYKEAIEALKKGTIAKAIFKL
ncbi:hypothetical protein HHI36_021122 [Cryptolaemus montrouzieri]|uniref:Enoyl reductase (ER) domain-containing protein n=1 Tax=Cryptolaemus montrouzieri TaxID=559131 RepID=A0ABD2MVS1_9CUCU